jgi:hypothetical protein
MARPKRFDARRSRHQPARRGIPIKQAYAEHNADDQRQLYHFMELHPLHLAGFAQQSPSQPEYFNTIRYIGAEQNARLLSLQVPESLASSAPGGASRCRMPEFGLAGRPSA